MGSYLSDWLQVSFGSKDDTEGTATGYPVVLLVGPLTGCEELRWKAYLNPRGTSTWITGKKQNKWKIFVESSCSSGQFLRQCGKADFTSDSMEKGFNPLLPEKVELEGPCLVEERDSQIYWTVWVPWPGMLDPQEHKALVNTGAQWTLMPSGCGGAETSCILEWQEHHTLLVIKISLTMNEWPKHPVVSGPETVYVWQRLLQERVFQHPKKASLGFFELLPWRWRKLSSCLPRLISQRILLLLGCWGLKNNLGWSLPQRCTRSNITLRLPHSHPSADSLTGESRSDQHLFNFIAERLADSMKDMFLVYHWNSLRYFQKFTHVMYKCNNMEKMSTWLLKIFDDLFMLGFVTSLI